MSAVLILDKASAIDRIIASSTRIEVPEEFARLRPRGASFERFDVPVGAPALVLASQATPLVSMAATDQRGVAQMRSERMSTPARVLASHLPRSLSWPGSNFGLMAQPEA